MTVQHAVLQRQCLNLMFKVSVFFTDTVMTEMLLLMDDCSVNDRLIKVAQFIN